MPQATPREVRVRAYDVGFGDAFLITFRYSSSERHVLVDLGSFPKPKRAGAGDLEAIAGHIAQTCGGRLQAVVATHRHADHINGFAMKGTQGPGAIIRACRPSVVVQPWTEHPRLATNATAPKSFSAGDRQLVAAIGDMQQFAAATLRRIRREPARWKGVREELAFLGENNLSNLSAVKNLMTMAPPKGRRYVHFGSPSGLEAVLPGVKIHVLGPPTIKQSSEVETQRRRDPEFWHLVARGRQLTAVKAAGPFNARYEIRSARPGYAQWLIQHVDALSKQQLLTIVRRMDDALNNTSVILLFEVGSRKLLFPGDAQIENWAFALKQPNVPALLSDVDVYKVGHHGSLNATPRQSLWEGFAKRGGTGKRLVTLLSTELGHHGKRRNRSEVPRDTLVSALKADSQLLRTDGGDLTREGKVSYVEITLPC